MTNAQQHNARQDRIWERAAAFKARNAIRSLADLRRALATPGLTMTVVEHWQPQLVGTTRCVKEARNNGRPGLQTNGYWFDGPDREGKIREMWADIPKAGKLGFDGSDCVTWYPGSPKSWTIRFWLPGEPRW